MTIFFNTANDEVANRPLKPLKNDWEEGVSLQQHESRAELNVKGASQKCSDL